MRKTILSDPCVIFLVTTVKFYIDWYLSSKCTYIRSIFCILFYQRPITVNDLLFAGINFRNIISSQILEFVDLTTLPYKRMGNSIFVRKQISWFTEPTKMSAPQTMTLLLYACHLNPTSHM